MKKSAKLASDDPEIRAGLRALRQAARDALKLAEATGTPCLVMKKGRIVDINPTGKRERSKRRKLAKIIRDELIWEFFECANSLPPKLDHFVVHVSNWRRSNNFYTKVLGAQLLKRGNGYAYRLGNVQLNCHGPGVKPNPVAKIPVRPGNSDICFQWHGSIESARAHLNTHRVQIELGPVARHGAGGPGESLYFRDPDGSLLEFICYSRSA